MSDVRTRVSDQKVLGGMLAENSVSLENRDRLVARVGDGNVDNMVVRAGDFHRKRAGCRSDAGQESDG